MAIQKGTGFTNLNRIMQANKGNKLGQTVSSGIQGQVQGVKTQVKSAQEQFQEEAQKNRLDTQEAAGKRSEILGRFAPSSGATAVPQGPTPPTQPGAAPIAGTQSPVSEQEIQDFTKYRTGTYTGPKELQDSTSLFGKAQQAEQLGGLAKSEGGRQELLRRFVGGKDYTAGQRQLDTSLLGQKPGQLGAAAREARGASQLVSGANQQASNLAQEYTGRAKGFGEETTRMLGETKTPLSGALDTQVAAKQAAEQERLSALQNMQDVLVGESPEYAGLDKLTRAGLALQSAADRGDLSQGDIAMLLGQGDKTGLIQRGLNLGLDVNSMLNERIKNTAAQNVGRTGVASAEEIAKLNALDRLSGKQGTDLEFLEGQGKYAAGKTGFDIGSLEDYISKTEAEKAASDAAYADKLAAEKARYLNQALAYGAGTLGSADQAVTNMVSTPTGLVGVGTLGTGAGLGMAGAQTAGTMGAYGAGGAGAAEIGAGAAGGAGAIAPVAVAAMLGADTLTGKDTTAQTTQAGINTGLGATGTAAQGTNAILEGLTKLNVGGKSIADTEAGRQLLKAIDSLSKSENKAIQGVSDISQDWTGGIGGLTKHGLSDISKGNISTLAKNIAGAGGIASGARLASNTGKAVSNAVKSITGGGVKLSDEDFKTNIDYDPKDIQKFMDRIKPAAYDYKDEVKNSPLASKNRELGVMAQDLEKSKVGKEAVHDTSEGKIVDYDNLEPKMLASIAALNKRLNELENKK